VRTALGTATLVFYIWLFAAASNDYLAKVLEVPVGPVTNFFRVGLFVLPVLFGWMAYRLMGALARSEASNIWHIPASALRKPRAEVGASKNSS
jgi:ubiquinol-cytochrome c reductase cytochrome b subunit